MHLRDTSRSMMETLLEPTSLARLGLNGRQDPRRQTGDIGSRINRADGRKAGQFSLDSTYCTYCTYSSLQLHVLQVQLQRHSKTQPITRLDSRRDTVAHSNQLQKKSSPGEHQAVGEVAERRTRSEFLHLYITNIVIDAIEPKAAGLMMGT